VIHTSAMPIEMQSSTSSKNAFAELMQVGRISFPVVCVGAGAVENTRLCHATSLRSAARPVPPVVHVDIEEVMYNLALLAPAATEREEVLGR